MQSRIRKMIDDGRHFTDDSKMSEMNLHKAVKNIIEYATNKSKSMFNGCEICVSQEKHISLYDCQRYFEVVGGPAPNPNKKNVYMKPDGGILYIQIRKVRIPILIIEDKVQGTNDLLYANDKKRQATGNAIERSAKNIRGAEMLFSQYDFFPYVIFASGCDFHSSETISARLEMMNFGFPNHYISVEPSDNESNIYAKIQSIIPNISIKKCCGKSVASIFVKAHKYNQMKHGSSKWTTDEYTFICCKIIDLVLNRIKQKILENRRHFCLKNCVYKMNTADADSPKSPSSAQNADNVNDISKVASPSPSPHSDANDANDAKDGGGSQNRLSDTEIKIFNSICNFVDDIYTYLHSIKQAIPPVARYNELLKHTKIIHKKNIRKHIDAFKAFISANSDAILAKDLTRIKKDACVIKFSDNVYLDIIEIVGKCDDESKGVVRDHLVNFTYLFNPTDEMRATLQSLISATSTAEHTAGGGGGPPPNLGRLFETIEKNLDKSDPNPISSVMKLVGSPAFGEIVAEVQNIAQSGGLNDILGALLQGGRGRGGGRPITQ